MLSTVDLTSEETPLANLAQHTRAGIGRGKRRNTGMGNISKEIASAGGPISNNPAEKLLKTVKKEK